MWLPPLHPYHGHRQFSAHSRVHNDPYMCDLHGTSFVFWSFVTSSSPQLQSAPSSTAETVEVKLSKFIQHLTTEWLIHPSMIPVFCRRQAAIPDAPVQQEMEKTTQLHPNMIPVLCNKKHSRLPCHRQWYLMHLYTQSHKPNSTNRAADTHFPTDLQTGDPSIQVHCHQTKRVVDRNHSFHDKSTRISTEVLIYTFTWHHAARQWCSQFTDQLRGRHISCQQTVSCWLWVHCRLLKVDCPDSSSSLYCFILWHRDEWLSVTIMRLVMSVNLCQSQYLSEFL